MTFEDFKFKVRRNTNFDRYWYYGLCISIIAFCLFSSLFITIRPEKFKEFRALLYSLLLFFILLAAYGIYLLPNRYKIVTVDSKLTVDKKHNVIIRLLEEYKVSGNPGEQFYASFTLRRRFWHMPYDVYLFFDEQRFAFSIQPQDFLSGGFIDFGGAERKRNEIANRIMELSVEELPVANSALAEAGLTE